VVFHNFDVQLFQYALQEADLHETLHRVLEHGILEVGSRRDDLDTKQPVVFGRQGQCIARISDWKVPVTFAAEEGLLTGEGVVIALHGGGADERRRPRDLPGSAVVDYLDCKLTRRFLSLAILCTFNLSRSLWCLECGRVPDWVGGKEVEGSGGLVAWHRQDKQGVRSEHIRASRSV
jgi:hypothetical protein